MASTVDRQWWKAQWWCLGADIPCSHLCPTCLLHQQIQLFLGFVSLHNHFDHHYLFITLTCRVTFVVIILPLNSECFQEVGCGIDNFSLILASVWILWRAPTMTENMRDGFTSLHTRAAQDLHSMCTTVKLQHCAVHLFVVVAMN